MVEVETASARHPSSPEAAIRLLRTAVTPEPSGTGSVAIEDANVRVHVEVLACW
jgi:hypothetical protein